MSGLQKIMDLTPRELLTGAEWLVAGGTLMGALVIGVRKVYRLARNVEDTLEQIGEVQKQLSPNGGSSLYDKVNAIRADQSDHGEQISDIKSRLRRLERFHLHSDAETARTHLQAEPHDGD